MPVWGWCSPCLSAAVYLNNAHAFHRRMSWRLASFHNTTSLFKPPSSLLLLSSLIIMSAIAMTSSTTILAARPRATVYRYVAAELVVE